LSIATTARRSTRTAATDNANPPAAEKALPRSNLMSIGAKGAVSQIAAAKNANAAEAAGSAH
jgi:hypothetical protein